MKFFKPEDFYSYAHAHPTSDMYGVMASIANAKLEREGKVVYGITTNGIKIEPEFVARYSTQPKIFRGKDDVRALLINIEPIEVCTHKEEKVKVALASSGDNGASMYFECECGAKLKPKTFEEV